MAGGGVDAIQHAGCVWIGNPFYIKREQAGMDEAEHDWGRLVLMLWKSKGITTNRRRDALV